jgi:membrane protease YdiL (CAAX protease family)
MEVRMARFRYSKWALTAIFCGVVLTAIEVVGAVGYLLSQDQPSYLVAGGAAVTVVAAFLIPLAERCWRRGGTGSCA